MRVVSAFALFAAFTLAGCGGKKGPDRPKVTGVKVSGKVVQGSSPIKFIPNETIKLMFLSADASISVLCEVNKDTGAFEMNGPDNEGIPAGKYKILLMSETYPAAETDRFADKFDLKTTPFLAEVSAEQGQVFTVDVTAKKVTKAGK